MNNKLKILDYIKNQRLMVISTVGKDNIPESAVVSFSETDDLDIIFGTFNNTRKYNNLLLNPGVSVVIGWDEDENITVQYEGIAEEAKGKELEKLREIHLRKNPRSKKYAFEHLQRFFIIKPLWVRYSNFSKDPEEIFEIDIKE